MPMVLSKGLFALCVTASAQHSAALGADDVVALVAGGARIWRSPSEEEKPPYKPPKHHIEEHLPQEGTKAAQRWHLFEKNRAVRRERRQAKWDAEAVKRAKSAQAIAGSGPVDFGEKIPISVKDPTGKKITVYALSKANVQPMFEKIVRRFGYSEEQARDLHFVWKDQELDPTDVPVEIGLEAGSLISLEGEPGRQRKVEAITQDRQEAKAQREAEENEQREAHEQEQKRSMQERDMIHLRFRDPSSQKEVRLAFKRRNSLSNLFKIVCKRLDLVQEKTRFVVDVSKKTIDENQSAFNLNLHEDDLIRVARAY